MSGSRSHPQRSCAQLPSCSRRTSRGAERRQAEVTQRLNVGVAIYVTRELTLIDPRGVNHEALDTLAHRVMTVNPSAEVCLLDARGEVARRWSRRIGSAAGAWISRRFAARRPEVSVNQRSATIPTWISQRSSASRGTEAGTLGFTNVTGPLRT